MNCLAEAENEFNLEPQLVELINLLGILFNISTEQQTPTDSLRGTAVDEVDDSNLTLQGDMPYPCRVQVNVRLHRCDPGEATQVGEVHFAIILALSAPLLLLTRVEVAQIRITAQFTDHVQLAAHCPTDKVR